MGRPDGQASLYKQARRGNIYFKADNYLSRIFLDSKLTRLMSFDDKLMFQS